MGNKPAIQYVVEELVHAGIRDIILVCNRAKAWIAEYFAPNAALHRALAAKGLTADLEAVQALEALAAFTVVYQDEPRGLGDAVLAARPAVRDTPFVVCLPDDLIFHPRHGLKELLEECAGDNPFGLLLQQIAPEQAPAYGIVRGKALGAGRFQIAGAVEKPTPHEAPSDLRILGRYCFPPTIFQHIAGTAQGALGEIQLTDAINALANHRPGIGLVCDGQIFDVGTPRGFAEACGYVLQRPG